MSQTIDQPKVRAQLRTGTALIGMSDKPLLLDKDQAGFMVGMSGWAWAHSCRHDARLPQPVNFPFPESKGKRWRYADMLTYSESLVTEQRQKPLTPKKRAYFRSNSKA